MRHGKPTAGGCLWVRSEPTEPVVEPKDPREVLITLYNATGGSSWSRSENWLTDAPLGSWYGVGTDETGRVVSLSLQGNNLTGSDPAGTRQPVQLGKPSSRRLGPDRPDPAATSATLPA